MSKRRTRGKREADEIHEANLEIARKLGEPPAAYGAWPTERLREEARRRHIDGYPYLQRDALLRALGGQ